MRDDEMTDRALDDEIARALGIEPSTGLAARIRRRVAAEQMSPRWTVSWLFLSATVSGAVAAALIALAIARQNGASQPSASILAAHAMAPQGAATPVVRSPGVRLETGNFVAVASARLDPGATATANTDPEILIDPREARAIRTFIDNPGRSRLDMTAPFDSSVPPVVETEPIRDIYIAPIDMSLLTDGEETRGAGPRE